MEKQVANDVEAKFSFRKIIKINMVAYILSQIFVCLIYFHQKGVLLALGASIFLTVLVYILYHYKIVKNEILISVSMAAVGSITSFYIFSSSKEAAVSVLGFIVNIALTALYFRRGIILGYAILLNIALVAFHVLATQGAIDFGNSNFIYIMLTYDIAFVVLYVLTKWGNDLVVKAGEKGKESIELLSTLQLTMDEINVGKQKLDSGIKDSVYNMESIKDVSESISKTVEEVSRGISEQSENITEISSMMNEADNKISETARVSKVMAEVSNKASKIIVEGSKNVIQMDDQMKIISGAVAESLSTVTELQSSMDEINNFLEGINQIAQQTNLLSLNAAIEAARAGESGKGFAVVAEEIRKLADQSAKIVSMINDIVTKIKNKSNSALEKVQDGRKATDIGNHISKQVSENFEKVNLSFKDIDSCIENELKMIENTISIFNKVNQVTQNISSISEEHAASSQEISATLEEHNNKIEDVFKNMQTIQKASEDLNQILNQGN